VVAKPDTEGDGVSGNQKPVRSATKTRQPGGENPSNRAEKPDTQADTQTEEQSKQSNSKAAAGKPLAEKDTGAIEPDAAVVVALTEIGVGEPRLEALARRWKGIADGPSKIRRRAADLRSRGKGTGAIISELEAQAKAERAIADRERASRRENLGRRAAELAANRQIEREQGEWKATIAALSDDELADYKQRVIEQATPFLRPIYRTADPRKNLFLMAEIYRLAREGQCGKPLPVARETGQT
jgi:hypothetical protein